MGVVVLLAAIFGLCLLLYKAAVYALPLFVGLWVGLWSLQTGAGIGALVLGIVAAAVLFGLGRYAVAASAPPIRWVIIAVFVVPSAIAGYSIVLQLAETGLVPSPFWRQAFGVLAALSVGTVTASRLQTLPLK